MPNWPASWSRTRAETRRTGRVRPSAGCPLSPLRSAVTPRLASAGIGEADLPRLAADAMKQTRRLVNNPRELTSADALAIDRAAS